MVAYLFNNKLSNRLHLKDSQCLIQQTGSDTADRAAHVDGQKRVRHHAEGCQKPFLSLLMRFQEFKMSHSAVDLPRLSLCMAASMILT